MNQPDQNILRSKSLNTPLFLFQWNTNNIRRKEKKGFSLRQLLVCVCVCVPIPCEIVFRCLFVKLFFSLDVGNKVFNSVIIGMKHCIDTFSSYRMEIQFYSELCAWQFTPDSWRKYSHKKTNCVS